MLTTANFEQFFFESFSPISLDALNHKAAMLTRLDNKYVVRGNVLFKALELLSTHFDVLEIEQQRSFTYETCYFDDEELSCYHQHHQGRRQRIKVRTRKYCDANLCYLEIKLKDVRGATIKKRLPYDMGKHGQLDEAAIGYIEQVNYDLYRRAFGLSLTPKLEMHYKRATLVAKQGGERLTIDCNIHFKKEGETISTSSDVFIVETKSANANGVADAILRQYHQHPTNKLSKYCIGMCITNQVNKMNNFMPALRKLGVLKGTSSLNDAVI